MTAPDFYRRLPVSFCRFASAESIAVRKRRSFPFSPESPFEGILAGEWRFLLSKFYISFSLPRLRLSFIAPPSRFDGRSTIFLSSLSARSNVNPSMTTIADEKNRKTPNKMESGGAACSIAIMSGLSKGAGGGSGVRGGEL